jgi:hypothetical protein
MAKTCDGGYGGPTCTPGCYPPGQTCRELRRDWSCSFAPAFLRDALAAPTSTWNEMVVDTRSIEVNLPAVVLAFFHLPRSDRATMSAFREGFMREYRLRPPNVPPLLALDPSSDAPFSLVA